jgi:hypothetical protein
MIKYAPDSICQRVGSAFDEGQQRRPRVISSAWNVGRDYWYSGHERFAHDQRESFAFGWQEEEARLGEHFGHGLHVTDEVHPVRNAEILGKRALG